MAAAIGNRSLLLEDFEELSTKVLRKVGALAPALANL